MVNYMYLSNLLPRSNYTLSNYKPIFFDSRLNSYPRTCSHFNRLPPGNKPSFISSKQYKYHTEFNSNWKNNFLTLNSKESKKRRRELALWTLIGIGALLFYSKQPDQSIKLKSVLKENIAPLDGNKNNKDRHTSDLEFILQWLGKAVILYSMYLFPDFYLGIF